MATYNKRGIKKTKEKEEKLDGNSVNSLDNVEIKNSKTAKAFDKLDETASKTEEFVARNQKYIIGILGAIAIATLGYLLYQRFIVEPKEQDANDDLFVAQQNFQKAVDATVSKTQDSLFNLVLKGAEGKQGVTDISSQYSGTDAANLSNYYAGISYLNLKKYDDAIKYLEQFSSNDTFLGALAVGAIGDAHAQKKDAKKALEFYVKASAMNPNDFTTPRFLLKAGQTSLSLANKADALKYFTEIKEKYESAPEAQQVDALIGLSQ